MARGNPGHRPINRDEPTPDVVCPPPPDSLQGEARAEWTRRAEQLQRLGVLTEMDTAAFLAYCRAWGRYIDAEERITKVGEVVISRSGDPMPNPYRAVANRALRFCQQFWSEFGMTPSSRTRVKVTRAKTPADRQHARFFGVSK